MDTFEFNNTGSSLRERLADSAGHVKYNSNTDKEYDEVAAVGEAFARKQALTDAAIVVETTRREEFAKDLALNMTYMRNIGNNPHLIHIHAKIILDGQPYTNASQKRPRFIFANLYPERSQPSVSTYWYAVQVALKHQWDEARFIEELMEVSVYSFKEAYSIDSENKIKQAKKPMAKLSPNDDGGVMVLFPKDGEFNGFNSISEPTLCVIEPAGKRRVTIRFAQEIATTVEPIHTAAANNDDYNLNEQVI